MTGHAPSYTKSYLAGAAITKRRFLKGGSANGALIQAVDGAAAILGVSAELDAASGARVDVHQAGAVDIECGGAVTRFQYVTATTGGKAVNAADSDVYVGGLALASGVSGDIVPIWVVPALKAGLTFDPNQVDDSALYALGTRARRPDGTEWRYQLADATVAASDVVIIDEDGTAAPVTTALAAAGAGTGKPLAAAPLVPSQAITTGKYFWACVYAPATAGIKANCLVSAVKFTTLQTTTTAGKLDDTAVAATPFVVGLVATTTEPGSGTAALVAVIEYPRALKFLQGS